MTAFWCGVQKKLAPLRGGIIIPDSAKDKPQEGEIISVGNGRTNDEGKLFPLALKKGDHVLFGKYAGTEIQIDGNDFLIMKEEEVLGFTGAAKHETVGVRKEVSEVQFALPTTISSLGRGKATFDLQ